MDKKFQFKSGQELLDYLKANPISLNENQTIEPKDMRIVQNAAFNICKLKNAPEIRRLKNNIEKIADEEKSNEPFTMDFLTIELELALLDFFIEGYYSALLLHHELALPLENE